MGERGNTYCVFTVCSQPMTSKPFPKAETSGSYSLGSLLSLPIAACILMVVRMASQAIVSCMAALGAIRYSAALATATEAASRDKVRECHTNSTENLHGGCADSHKVRSATMGMVRFITGAKGYDNHSNSLAIFRAVRRT